MIARDSFPMVVKRDQSIPDAIRLWTPKSKLGFAVLRSLSYLPEDLKLELVDRIRSATIMESELRLTVHRNLGIFLNGEIPWSEVKHEDYGLVSVKVVTTVGVGFLVDALENLVEPELMKFHALGTGSTAESSADTALVTELTTEYNPNGTRATGTTSETSANIYQTVATNTLDSGTPALREHGIFSASSVGVLLDRSVYASITLDGTAGDGMTTDYRLTLTAGG